MSTEDGDEAAAQGLPQTRRSKPCGRAGFAHIGDNAGHNK